MFYILTFKEFPFLKLHSLQDTLRLSFLLLPPLESGILCSSVAFLYSLIYLPQTKHLLFSSNNRFLIFGLYLYFDLSLDKE